MGRIEDNLIYNFCHNIPHYLPEASGYACLEKAPVGDYYGSSKEIDLLLVERTSNVLSHLDYSKSIGAPFSRPKRNKASLLSLLPGFTKAWIIEAESSRRKLWEGIGQTFGYRALVSQVYRNLRIMGAAVIYPENEGIDELIEAAVKAIRSGLGIDLRILLVPVVRKPGKRINADLGDFPKITDNRSRV